MGVDESGEPIADYMAPVKAENLTKAVDKTEGVDAIVVGWDHCFSAMKVAIAATHLRRGYDREDLRPPVKLVTCSSDMCGSIGAETPDAIDGTYYKLRLAGNGVMTNAICASVGPHQEAINVGKPADMLKELLRRPESIKGIGGFGVNF